MPHRRLSIRIGITIDPELLSKVDAVARQLGDTRSGIIRRALWAWLYRHERDKLSD